MSSTTLGEAIELGLKYSHLVMPLISFSILNAGNVTVDLVPTVNFGTAQNTLIEVSMAALKCFIEQSSENFPIMGVDFQHSSPFSTEHYSDYFSCPVRFSCAANTLRAGAVDLSASMVSGNLQTAKLLELQLDDLTKRGLNAKPWIHKVDTYCQLNIDRLAGLSKQEVAAHLCITTRTLSRKLAQEGGNFQGILDSNFLQCAIRLLENNELNIEQISVRLGFSCAKYFSRTFKRLKDISPTDYRKALARSVKS